MVEYIKFTLSEFLIEKLGWKIVTQYSIHSILHWCQNPQLPLTSKYLGWYLILYFFIKFLCKYKEVMSFITFVSFSGQQFIQIYQIIF